MSTINGTTTNSFPTPQSTQTGPVYTQDVQNLNQNFNQFLTLLTTQLKNQDPLSPMDSTQFTNQLVSFSGVEQQIKMNDNMNKLLALSSLNMTSLGLSYIGKHVDMIGSEFKYKGGATGGDVSMTYTLPSDSVSTTITVLDKDGNTVYTKTGESAHGSHGFVWDGKKTDGTAVPDGTYKIRVSALDRVTQKPLTIPTTVPGLVEGTQVADDGTILLLINGFQVPMTDIRRVAI